jgi:putative oxidoreductase
MDNSRDYGIALLRIAMGGLVLVHGAIKLFIFTPAGTAGYFASLGLPAVLAYLTILLEVGGGFALIAGLYTRITSLALAVLMIGTIVTVHGANGFVFSNAGGGWEYPAFWAVALVAQALMGEGAFALRFRPSQTVAA